MKYAAQSPLRGLGAGVTNYMKAAHAAERTGTGRLASFSVALKPSGWDGVRVNPRSLQANLNYVLVGAFAGQPAPRTDPVIVENTGLDRRGSAGAAALRAIADARAVSPAPQPPRPLAPIGVGANVSLSPQPLPPRAPIAPVQPAQPLRMGSASAAAISSVGSAQALNPQPLPPRAPVPVVQAPARLSTAPSGAVTAIGAAQSLNPQPLPPRGTPIPAGGMNASSSLRATMLR